MLYNQVMIIPDEERAIEAAIKMLCKWLDCDASQANALEIPQKRNGDGLIDAAVELKQTIFLLEYRQSGQISSVAGGIDHLQRADEGLEDTVKVLVVPYMFELGRQRCESAGISWLDLSGNADVKAPGIRIFVQGMSNRFKRPGRPTNVFAPKSSRVSRILLYNPRSAFMQSELAELAVLGEGYVSRIVRTLEDQNLVERVEEGKVMVRDQALLLDAWFESYDFQKHTIHKGYVPARSGSALQQRLSDYLSREGIEHAVTGLGAAWQYTQFAAFRTLTVFVDNKLSPDMLMELDFNEGGAGSNTWLVIPNDQSVFWSANVVNGIRCVHLIQAYLDLRGQPERANEAMEELRHFILRSTT